jgi:hypothetical protein
LSGNHIDPHKLLNRIKYHTVTANQRSPFHPER